MTPTVHGCAVLVGPNGVLIRGASGAGKSRLVLALLDRAQAAGHLARLVSDDRVCLEIHHGRLIASAPAQTAGLIEQRGIGIRSTVYEPEAVVRLVVDIVPVEFLERLPESEQMRTQIDAVGLPRIAVPGDPEIAIPLILTALKTGTLAGP